MHLMALARKYCPRTRWMSNTLTKMKLRKSSRFLLPEQQVLRGEAGAEARQEILSWCRQHWSEAYQSAERDARKDMDTAGVSASPESREILADILFCHFAYGFTSDEYFAFALQAKSPEERRCYVSNRYRNRMAIALNDFFDAEIFLDKYRTYLEYRDVFKRDAVRIESDKDKPDFLAFVNRHASFIKKRVDLARGESVELVSTDGDPMKNDALFREIRKSGTCILEECIRQGEALAVFHPASVNTVRCVAFWGKDGVEIPYCILRTGRGGSVIDNASAGGISAAIDPKTGIVTTDGMDERNHVFREHPDGHVTFKGCQLPEWPALLALIDDIATRRQGIRFIGWDLAYSTKGWCVVEGNFAPQLEARQVLCGGMKEEFDRLMGQSLDA